MSVSAELAGGSSQRVLAGRIAAAVVAVDAISKAIAVQVLTGRGLVNLFGGRFHLLLYRNHAGPGNILQGHPLLVSVLSLLAVVLIAAAAWSVRTRVFAIALGLLLGGGIGNSLDRVLGAPGPLRGGVIDWIKPTLAGGSMNLADLAINAAVIVLAAAALLDLFRRRDELAGPAPSA